MSRWVPLMQQRVCYVASVVPACEPQALSLPGCDGCTFSVCSTNSLDACSKVLKGFVAVYLL
jgi:hypothetical protein